MPVVWDAKKIRKLRERYGENRPTFARRMDVSEFTLRAWEQGIGEPIGPAKLLLSRLEEDIEAGKVRELQAT